MLCPYFLWFCTSILYSSSSSIISGGSTRSMCCLLKCGFLHHVSRFSLNTLWIAHPFSSSSWNAFCSIFFEILKGPYLFWSNFFEGQFEWIFLASSYIFSPSFNPCRFHLFLSNYLFMASFAIFIDYFAAFQLLHNSSRKSSNFGNSVLIVRSSFHRYFLKFNLNREYPVAICFLSLYWNSTTDNHSV